MAWSDTVVGGTGLKKHVRATSLPACLMAVLAVVASVLIGPVATAPDAQAGTGPIGGIIPMAPTRIFNTRPASRSRARRRFGVDPDRRCPRLPGRYPSRGPEHHSHQSPPRRDSSRRTTRGSSTPPHLQRQLRPGAHRGEPGRGGGRPRRYITIENTSAGSVQVVVDASGYFATSGVRGRAGLLPCGGTSPGSRHQDLVRSCGRWRHRAPAAGRTTGVPANASAVVVNLTVTEPTSYGFISAYPAGSVKTQCFQPELRVPARPFPTSPWYRWAPTER